MSSLLHTGFRTIEAPDEFITELYKNKKCKVWDGRLSLYPNLYLELRSKEKEKHTALARVLGDSDTLELVSIKKIGSISPRNREQAFVLHSLIEQSITVCVFTGSAGVGKTFLALNAAIELIQNRRYKRVVLTRPMSQVGKYDLGLLPGSAQEKMAPYLLNYTTNLEQFVGRKSVDTFLEQYDFEVIPLQLMRGASFNDTLLILDEAQVLGFSEILTIGTRIGEGSKVVIMGDLNQRDDKIAKDKTGIYKLFHDPKAKQSPLVAAIELQKCERSETSRLFSSIFEE